MKMKWQLLLYVTASFATGPADAKTITTALIANRFNSKEQCIAEAETSKMWNKDHKVSYECIAIPSD